MVHHSFSLRNFPPSFPRNRKEQRRYDYSPGWIYLGLLPCQSNSTCKFSRSCSYTYRSKSSHIKVISRVTSLVQCFLFLGNILATIPSVRLVFCMTQNPSQILFLCFLKLVMRPICRTISERSGHTRSFFFIE